MSQVQNRSVASLLGALQTPGVGDVAGPASATNNALARYSGTTGKLLKDSSELLFDGTDVTLAGKILARKAVNVTEVFSASDLPAPSGGVITLPDGVYVLKNDIVLANPLKVAAAATVEITSAGAGTSIVYTGTGPFFQSDPTALFFLITTLVLVLTANNVELFDTDGPSILLDRAVVVFTGSGGSLGTSINHELAFSIRSSRISGFEEGLTVFGSLIFSLINVAFESPVVGSTPLLSVNGGTTTMECDNLSINANVGDEIFYIDPVFAGFATINRISNINGSDFFAVGSLNETNPRVVVADSPPQKASMNIGFVTASGVAVETVISTIGVYVDLNLDFSAVPGSSIELWSVTDTDTGEITYNGLDPFNGSIIATLTASSLGAADEFNFRAVKNGSPLIDDIMAGREIGNIAVSITLLAPVTADPGDTIRLQVANVDSTSNVTIRQISIQVT